MTEKPEVTWHDSVVPREERERLTGHHGCIVWLTGLSGSGKSTIANLVDQKLSARGLHSFLLDGDNLRHGLNATAEMLRDTGSANPDRFGLGFAEEDRQENIRRVGAVAQLFASAGLLTLVAFVATGTPFASWFKRPCVRMISSRFLSMPRWRSVRNVTQKDSINEPGQGNCRE